jgi:glycosyltransferase involved in cell wall biosynthesis
MNILFVADVSIADVVGGAERVLFEQTIRLAKRGHAVHILTRMLPEHRREHEIMEGVQEWRYRVNTENPLSFFASILRNGRSLFERLNARIHFDCLNFHQPFSAFSVLRTDGSRNMPKIYTCHSLAFEEFASRNPRPPSGTKAILYRLHLALRRKIERRSLGESDQIIVLSEYTRDKLCNVYGAPLEKITVVPGGIDLGRFHPAADKDLVRERLGLPTGRIMLLTIRNLVPRMGIENLINAMREVVKVLPDVLLIIGGTGPLQDSLALMSSQADLDCHIRFTGFIAEEQLPEYYRAADIFVLPTVELEGFGLVTLEALASGIPVLGTPVGGTREILGRLDGRFLFRNASSEAMSQLIVDLCRQYRAVPDTSLQDSARCREFVERYYSWDVNVVATEGLFLEATKRSAGASI